jgi:hypothetical protein
MYFSIINNLLTFMQFLFSRVKIFFVIFLITAFFLTNSKAAVLRFQRNINWKEEKNITKGEQVFSNFISFKDALLTQNTHWQPYWNEVFRLNTAASNIKVNIQKIVFGNLDNKHQIQNQEILKNVKDYNKQIIIGYEMGKSVVGLTFLPIGYDEATNHSSIVTSFEIEITYDVVSPQVLKLNKKGFVSSSVLANGDWFKIAVTKTGFHKLDRNFFQTNGINISGIDPRTIKVYGNGPGLLPQANSATRSDDLVENAILVVGENDGVFDAGDYVLMYGKSQFDVWKQSGSFVGREKNIYSDTTYYFITFNQGTGKRIAKQASQPNVVNVQNYHTYCHAHELDILNFGKSGRQFLGEAFDRIPTQNFSFYIDGHIPSDSIIIKSVVASRSIISPSNFGVSVNNNFLFSHSNIPTISNTYDGYYYRTSGPVVASFYSPTPAVNVTYRYDNPPGGAIGWLDYFEINTKANLSWYGNQVLYRVTAPEITGATRYSITGAPMSARIFNIGDLMNIQELLVDRNGNDASYVNNTTSYTEFAGISDGSSYWAPSFVGKIGNQNLHGLSQSDAIYITPGLFFGEAMRLAAFHQPNGIKIHVVNVNDIYNEFSSGSQDVTAIRDFLRMFYTRGSSANDRVKYVTLFGRASYDYKYRVSSNSNFVPTYQSSFTESPTLSYCSDDYYGFLDDNEGMWDSGANPKEFLDLGIGRLPISNATEARNAVDKIINYYQSDRMADWRNKIVFVSDDEDYNIHQNDANNMANNVTSRFKNYNIEKIWIDAYREEVVAGGQRNPGAQKAIVDAVQKGCFIINYTGHGGELGWAAERILTIEDVNGWSNLNRLPLFVTATCEFSRFDDPARVSAGELTFLSTKGGSIALFTTVRLVDAFSNTMLNTYFYNRIGLDSTSKQSPKPLGEIMRLTKNDYLPNDKNERNFTLLGDAVMVLAYPKYNVVTTSINNKVVVDVTDTLKALSKVTITGKVTDVSGNLLSNYNGQVFPTVYDKASTYQTLVNNKESAPSLQFNMQNNIIYSGSASVVNGIFTFSFIVPKDISYQLGRGKISYYTTNQVNDGNGYNENFVVGGTADSVASDGIGPAVKLYMDDEKFVFGGLTNENPLFIAKLFDENGINTIGRGIGRELTLIIDGDNTKSVSVNDYYKAKTNSYQEGEIRYPLKNIASGKHTATLKSYDTYNNFSENTTEFVVASNEKLALQYVLNYPNPFTSNTTFHFDHNKVGENLTVIIYVYTVSGKLAKTLTAQVTPATSHFDQITWNGLDDYGDKLANGVYIYKVQVKSMTGKTAEATQKLVILN